LVPSTKSLKKRLKSQGGKMKILPLVLVLFTTAAFAAPTSYEDLVGAMTTVEVSPVNYEGKRVSTKSASGVCHSLGYSLVVSKESEVVYTGNQTLQIASSARAANYATRFWFPVIYQYKYIDLLKSVTCGR